MEEMGGMTAREESEQMKKVRWKRRSIRSVCVCVRVYMYSDCNGRESNDDKPPKYLTPQTGVPCIGVKCEMRCGEC